jgi:nucleoside-diphosphate-sugar epimerase
MSALAGRTALVTGAGRGIGLAITQRLLADGASVVMVDRDAAAVEGAAKRLGAAARAIVADVTRTADVHAAVTAAHDWHGRLDIVVNNAGITGRSFPTWQLTDDDWHQVLAVDLTSVFLVCRAAVTLMRERRRGRIVNIASIAGKEGNATLVPYSTAKAGGPISLRARRPGGQRTSRPPSAVGTDRAGALANPRALGRSRARLASPAGSRRPGWRLRPVRSAPRARRRCRTDDWRSRRATVAPEVLLQS